MQQRSSPLEVRVQKNVRLSLKWCLAKGFWILLCSSKKSICSNLKRYVFHFFCLNTTVGWSWWHVVSFFFLSPLKLPSNLIGQAYLAIHQFLKPTASGNLLLVPLLASMSLGWFFWLLATCCSLCMCACVVSPIKPSLGAMWFFCWVSTKWVVWAWRSWRQVSQCHYTDPNMPFANPSSQLCEEPCNASLLGEMYSDTVSEHIQYTWYVMPLVSWNVPGEQHWGLWRAGRCNLQFTFSLWNQIVFTSMLSNTGNDL